MLKFVIFGLLLVGLMIQAGATEAPIYPPRFGPSEYDMPDLQSIRSPFNSETSGVENVPWRLYFKEDAPFPPQNPDWKTVQEEGKLAARPWPGNRVWRVLPTSNWGWAYGGLLWHRWWDLVVSPIGEMFQPTLWRVHASEPCCFINPGPTGADASPPVRYGDTSRWIGAPVSSVQKSGSRILDVVVRPINFDHAPPTWQTAGNTRLLLRGLMRTRLDMQPWRGKEDTFKVDVQLSSDNDSGVDMWGRQWAVNQTLWLFGAHYGNIVKRDYPIFIYNGKTGSLFPIRAPIYNPDDPTNVDNRILQPSSPGDSLIIARKDDMYRAIGFYVPNGTSYHLMAWCASTRRPCPDPAQRLVFLGWKQIDAPRGIWGQPLEMWVVGGDIQLVIDRITEIAEVN